MGDTKRVRSDLKRGISVMSTAASEAFCFLNKLTQREYRGWGDTATAARERAARNAGITPAQAERVWKRWQRMASIDGDVYRALRNKYEALCEANEQAADAYRAERLQLRNGNAVDQKHGGEGVGTTFAGD
ncbi:hypothetical protein LB545_07655 [Mesorhizobium sp. BR1-1-6]|uniref:hypothetical protein n=1 Tax=Mesorhizobium sp. BR1-1-6 TaxID=2876648 RepID=UPI001CD14AFE|nr:hypothetical protein [Mesorhizobium sp. BR1-1-6]MBZ9894218.1 hypothetical protein [Mesorhizobium sp. BR1-1-6]